jgi:hypothetical protein
MKEANRGFDTDVIDIRYRKGWKHNILPGRQWSASGTAFHPVRKQIMEME